ncbi:type II toxin-antitoxin system HicA family toxin [Adlercreutzia sp. ZJ242]|uniref:type II toxin-antitoxin system HicA family toxin n=1 Tax=Adlercreutzia sp. ZJ242 TaxID=2709409 RepID=UPI0013E9F68D|nr:type II toxin-antitoxin system HicA family toxin [Adlercreutzia sp. ZJ242]
MVKRRDLVRELTEAGFVSRGGRNHEVFVKPGYRTVVPYHRELREVTAGEIRKQAGLK